MRSAFAKTLLRQHLSSTDYSKASMQLLNRVSRQLDHVMKLLSGFLIAAMTILVFLQVIFRYLLDAPIDWSEEMASFAFVWMALLGASVGLKNDEHPRLDIF